MKPSNLEEAAGVSEVKALRMRQAMISLFPAAGAVIVTLLYYWPNPILPENQKDYLYLFVFPGDRLQILLAWNLHYDSLIVLCAGNFFVYFLFAYAILALASKIREKMEHRKQPQKTPTAGNLLKP